MVHISATRFAARRFFSGRLGHSYNKDIPETRCGSSSENFQLTSMTRSSALCFVLVAHEYITDHVQYASELASIWKGEYCSSGSGASMVIGPGSGSSRIEYSEVRMIFTHASGCNAQAVQFRLR